MLCSVLHMFEFFPFSVQVLASMTRVDRNAIERLRAFQNPPMMAGVVMVMIMVLIGRPEFAAGIGGAGIQPSSSSGREKKGDTMSTSGSDEVSHYSASRSGSASPKKSRSRTNLPMLGNTLL